jgi:hypothetical protein
VGDSPPISCPQQSISRESGAGEIGVGKTD